ncbi:MAG: acetyl-CoA carboxylase carboxyl transferase subunit alpha [bacterium]
MKKELTAWERVITARDLKRPKASHYIESLFSNFIELHGDQFYSDDKSMICGIGFFNNTPVTVLAQAKGSDTAENIERNFGSNNPEGFRKSLRLAKQAEKFNRPIITIVDTAGAFPGVGAEERGQSRAIAQNIAEFSTLKVPVISIVIGEGGSGGALALSVANKIIMLENAIYSIISPEGFTSILFKDTIRVEEATDLMELTSNSLFDKGIVDDIVSEHSNINDNFDKVIKDIKKLITKYLDEYSNISKDDIVEQRYKKFRKIGTDYQS